MPEQWHSVLRATRASTSRVLGILRVHPETAMTAILALAYPEPAVSRSFVTELVVGKATYSTDGVAHVALEWSLDYGAHRSVGFSGQLTVTPADSGTQLELQGIVRGEANSQEDIETAALDRVLSWLALATETEPIAEGT